MLATENRLTSGEEFRRAVRSGVRAGTDLMVVHWSPRPGSQPVQAGFVVSKAVGNAVVRNRVKRRLRHLTRECLEGLPGSGVLVVRARPGSATAEASHLRADLDKCLGRAVRRAAGLAGAGDSAAGSVGPVSGS